LQNWIEYDVVAADDCGKVKKRSDRKEEHP